jgi:hypothetical protein
VTQAKTLPIVQHPQWVSATILIQQWGGGVFVMGWGLGRTAGALLPWPLATGFVIRHDGEVEANSMSKVRKGTTAQD